MKRYAAIYAGVAFGSCILGADGFVFISIALSSVVSGLAALVLVIYQVNTRPRPSPLAFGAGLAGLAILAGLARLAAGVVIAGMA